MTKPLIELVPKNVLALRESLALTQAELAAKIGITGQSVSNYETATSTPDTRICLQLASIAPSPELRKFFSDLAGAAPELAPQTVYSDWSMGMTVHQRKPYPSGKTVWTREELEDPTEKYFWVRSLEGKSTEEKRKAAKSIGVSLPTIHRWMKLTRYGGGPEALLPKKKQRRMYQAVKPSTPEEAELVAKLLTVLRDPAVPKDALKQHLREAYGLIRKQE